MNTQRVNRFFITLWIAISLAIPLSSWISTLLGAPKLHPNEYPFIAGVYLLWVPLVPLLVKFARRFAPVPGRRLRVVLIHLGIGLAVILTKHFAHRAIFCTGFPGSYIDCVTAVRFESWFVHWIQVEYFVFAATIAGVWAFDAMERAHQRELAVAEKERELAAAELQAEHGHIAPHEMTALFASIGARLHAEPLEAEQMITRVADFLRLTVQVMRLQELGDGDDNELASARAELESARRGLPVGSMR